MAIDQAGTEGRSRLLTEALADRILVIGGPYGTYLHGRDLSAADYGGPQFEGCPEQLNVTRPDVIADAHHGYLDAGADIIATNTFGGGSIVLAEYGLQDSVHAINEAAARLAVRTAAGFATPGRPRFVAGNMGPTTRSLSITGGITFEAMSDVYHDWAAGLVAGGVDLLLLETQNDTRTIKAALIGIWRLFREIGRRLPVMVSATIELNGTMLAGQSVEALAASLQHADLLALGLNCSTGPEFMTDHVRSLAGLTEFRTSVWPNAGLPDEEGCYSETPSHMVAVLERFIDQGWLNIIGGCCGTTFEHTRAFTQLAAGKRPRIAEPQQRTLFSGVDFVEANDDDRPLIIGERTNEVGSRKFKRLISAEKYEEASEIARQQVKGGAQIIDVNLQNADRDELHDADEFYERLARKVRVPIMIDTTDHAAIERALTYCQGKSIINSINLEDGLEKFDRVTPLARAYGAALVVGCIDEDKEQAQAITRERKLAIAERSYALLTEQYGIRPDDIIFDPLVFPCATGDQNYTGSAVETIEGIRLIKQQLPRAKTILGISNVSFGLPDAGREVLNSVFLYHCTKAGLDLAIVNAEKLERYASIPEDERRLAEDLLWNAGDDPIAAFAAHFRGARSRARTSSADLPLDERLANYIIEGTKDGLVPDLDRKRQEAAPLEIINGALMAGMSEVGRLFNNNELIVAEVLQSAEAMKAAVSHLEQFMEKSATSTRGRILLATVKGDVHDIGKNLVDIILSNNGYDVVNLGIKVPPEVLIEAAREHRPDAIGLSGLLVKSAQQMVVTAGDLKEAGVQVPLLVGGAALSDRFTRTKIAPTYERGTVVYCNDAMNGLDTLNRLMDPEARTRLEAELLAHEPTPRVATPRGQEAPAGEQRSSHVRVDIAIPSVPDTDRHSIEIGGHGPRWRDAGEPRAVDDTHEFVDLDAVWSYINPQMLYGRHLGFKGRFQEALETGDRKAAELARSVERVKAECRKGAMTVRAAWRFFEAEPDGNRLRVFADESGVPAVTFTFPRQRKADGVAIPDLVLPPQRDASGRVVRRDHIAILVTTAGAGIRERAEAAKAAGEYVRSYALQALALETAEAAAEWAHARLRSLWGFPDAEETPRKDLFQARYRGKRYSFGYPACPDLESQALLFDLIRPEDLGVELTEGFMMEPEASVSAIVVHHPDAAYFSVGPVEDGEAEAAE
ncbi:MAG: methionine synthase [Dehalococcoidia bacterium]|nr:methionine synthase [Dehalococcoidia bacterium]